MSDERESYRVGSEADQVAMERERHGLLAELGDGATINALEKIGVSSGWRCLEVGAGGGSIARWLAARVGPEGSVLATDVDARFLDTGGAKNLTALQHDIVKEKLRQGAYDLVHARGLLQHLAQRDAVIDKLIAATKPGGWVLFEDSDWLAFDAQPIPEPFATLARIARAHTASQHGYDGALGRRYLPLLQGRGLEEVNAQGSVVTMHGGMASAEWFVLALDRAQEALIGAGVVTRELMTEALAQARRPDFKILGPTRISAWGRKPLAAK